MPKLVKNAQAVEHSWVLIRTEEELTAADLTNGQWLVPYSAYIANPEAYKDADRFGFWIASDADIEQVKAAVKDRNIIAIDFPVFADGRGFSLARTLRDHTDFSGEIRAVGNFIFDQIFYMSRCGFDAFEFADETDVNKALPFFSTFSESYQAGTDEPQPLFRRRA